MNNSNVVHQNTISNSHNNNGHNPVSSGDSALFTGREWVFQWLERTMAEQEGEAAPLVLYGERRIGKTAILKKLEAEPFDPKFVCVYVSAAELVKKADSWWWGLAKQCTDNLRGRGYTMPELNYTKFHKNELTSIHDYFLKPLLQAVGQKQLLLMIDDVHVLFDQEPWTNFLKSWAQVIRQYSALEVLLTAAATADDLYDTFSAVTVRTKLLGVLEGTAATELLRKLLPALTYGEAERYILRVTDNHPYYLRFLCGLLREHMQQQEILRPALADVAAVARSQAYLRSNPPVHPNDVEPVLITSLVSAEDAEGEATAAPNPAVRSPLVMYGGGAVLFILLVLFLLPDSRNYILGDGGTEATAVALANTATALAVPPVSSTPTPTDTPTLTPSPTPTDTPTLTPSPTPTDTPTPTPSLTPSPTATATAVLDREAFIRPQDGMPMILIPGGTFLQGTAEDAVAGAAAAGDADERPQREVTLDAFYLDQYEVSVAQYAAFLNELGGHIEACGGLDCARTNLADSYLSEATSGELLYLPRSNFEDYPINYVSWFGARDYCAWVGGRLPTEAEWEYAARGTDLRTYPWGEDEPNRSLAVFGSEFSALLPVDALPNGVSPFGIYALAGSMWEWNSDWYAEDYYSYGLSTNPTGAPQGDSRVVRGGSWVIDNDASRIRSANRNWFRPIAMRADVGFRCAYAAPSE